MIRKPVTYYLSVLFVLLGFNLSAQNIIARIDTSYANIKKVEVSAGFCRVEIGAISENGRVEFFGEISTDRKPNKITRSPYRFRHKIQGNLLKVWLEGKSRGSNLSESRLMFKVPPQTDIDVVSRSGKIYAFGLSGGYTNLKTHNGSIKAQYINSKVARFKSHSGDIKVENLNAEQVYFKSHSGYFKLTEAKAKKIEASNHMGGQRWTNIVAKLNASTHLSTIRVIKGKGEVRLKSHTGTLRVYDYVGMVNAQNFAGSIRLKNVHGKMNLQTNAGSIIGEGVLLINQSSLQTAAGYIKLKLKNELNKLDYDLRTGSGSVRIGENKHGKKYVTRNGNSTFLKAMSRSGSLSFGKYEEEK